MLQETGDRVFKTKSSCLLFQLKELRNQKTALHFSEHSPITITHVHRLNDNFRGSH